MKNWRNVDIRRIAILLTFLALLIGTAGGISLYGASPSPNASADPGTDQVLVKFRPGVGAADRSAVHQ